MHVVFGSIYLVGFYFRFCADLFREKAFLARLALYIVLL